MFKVEYKLRGIKDDDWKIWEDSPVYFKNRQIIIFLLNGRTEIIKL